MKYANKGEILEEVGGYNVQITALAPLLYRFQMDRLDIVLTEEAETPYIRVEHADTTQDGYHSGINITGHNGAMVAILEGIRLAASPKGDIR